MNIVENIEDFKQEYTKIIQNFSVIDKDDPITPEKLNQLQSALDSWLQGLTEGFAKNNKYKTDYEKKNQTYIQKYQQKIKSLNESLNKNLKNIAKDSIDACQKLRQKIEIAKKDTNYRIEQFEVEFDYFIATSEQSKIILTSDFNEAKKRYDYQRDEAKESYLEIVKKNNEVLKNIKEHFLGQYKQDYDILTQNQEKDLEKLVKIIEEQEKELTSINTALENERGNVKEKYRQESANLNENIKKIADEKNKLIDTARSQYNKSINDANIEKENNKAIYLAQSQALLRDFVTKINAIDENTSILKKEFEKKTDEIKREFYSEVFKKTKTFHKQLEQIYNASPSTIDKYTAHLIRYKNKQHISSINLSKKEKELILLDLTKDNTLKVLSNRNDKNFLEIDKNFAIKNITDQEQFDNKYYQENDNIYENDFNYTVKTANYRFSQQANLLRCQSQIRTKLLERNYDGISANYYKKIETIQNKIASYKISLEMTKKLNALVLSYLEETYHAHLHLEETNNLLEIEKNKILKEYNQSLYEHNVKNIRLAMEYGFKKIDLENQKAEENKKLKIELENLILEKNCESAEFSIKREELNESFAKIKTQIINNNDLRVAKESYITSLLQNDINYIEHILVSSSQFFDTYKLNYLKTIQILMKEIEPSLENYHFLQSFINTFLEIFLNFFERFFKKMLEDYFTVLDEKMDYIFDFKYKTSLDFLEEQHIQEVTLIKEKKNEILDKIDSSNKTIENFRQKIFTLINDNEMLLHNNPSKKKRVDEITLVSMKQTELKVKDYKEKIDNFTKMIRMYSDDILELNQKLSIKNAEYQSELQKIRKMFRDDILIYTDYKKQLQSYSTSIGSAILDFKRHHLLHASSPRAFCVELKGAQKRVQKLLDYAKSRFLREFDFFVLAANRDISSREHFCAQEFKDEVKKFNQKYNKSTLEYLTEYHASMAKHEEKIEEQSSFLDQMMEIYDHKLFIANQNFQADSNALDNLQHQIRTKFFSSYYALDDNNQNIIEYHLNQNAQKEYKFQKDKDAIDKDKFSQISLQNAKLKSFLKAKNEEIEHLPIAFKFNTKMLNSETKKKNIQLHEDLKQAKNNYNLQNKHIEKNIKSLKYHLTQDKFENELNQKRNIAKEKKNNLINLRQSLKSIKIDL